MKPYSQFTKHFMLTKHKYYHTTYYRHYAQYYDQYENCRYTVDNDIIDIVKYVNDG